MLSVCMISKNSASKIARSLESSSSIADEIIVVDQESTDDTAEICKSFGAKVYSEGENAVRVKGFGYLWNRALERASYNWILIMASDEFISPKLGSRMRDIVQSDNSPEGDLYLVHSVPVIFEKLLLSWSAYMPRLFKKGVARYDSSKIMERLLYPESTVVRKIQGEGCYLLNYTYDTWEEYITKMNLYTELEALDLCTRGIEASQLRGYYEAFVQICYRYFYRKGFLEGGFGLQMAIMSGFTRFLANAKHAEKAANLS